MTTSSNLAHELLEVKLVGGIFILFDHHPAKSGLTFGVSPEKHFEFNERLSLVTELVYYVVKRSQVLRTGVISEYFFLRDTFVNVAPFRHLEHCLNEVGIALVAHEKVYCQTVEAQVQSISSQRSSAQVLKL